MNAMKQSPRTRTLFWQIQTFPLFLLNLSRSKRILIVMLSYAVGIPGLWFVFPELHNGASMLLPLVCLCWLFSYQGLFISLFSTTSTIWLVYHFFAGNTYSVQGVVERATLGFIVSLLIGLVICWLRTALDLVHVARQQALAAEQERLLAIEKERQVTLNYEQQRKINELKDHFLLHVSHELCTPLAVLGGSLELLKEYHELLDPVECTQVLTQALVSQEELADLVHRVLDTASVVSEVPQSKPEAVCVHQLLQGVVAHLPPEEGDAYTIDLQVPEQTMVWADPRLLRQVLDHLLSNIFKYVPKGTAIQIETKQATLSSPVCLSIQDAGPGIPAEELPLLFERFVRLKRDLAGRTRGMGLGLYICKRLVEAMNGRIWVESSGRPGEGCRFCLTIPSSS